VVPASLSSPSVLLSFRISEGNLTPGKWEDGVKLWAAKSDSCNLLVVPPGYLVSFLLGH
jgi:hypothetical protein